MLDAAVPILREMHGRFPKGGATLEIISQVITGVTHLDRTHYTGIDLPRDNPIWGSFRRFDQSDGVYGGTVTVVDVRYAQHLTEDERVFVVSKELCHSLEAESGAHVVTDSAIDDLVAEFSVFSSQRAGSANAHDTGAFNLEMLATIVAAEIVCPIMHRRAVIAAAGEDPDWEAMGAAIKIPSPYRRGVCSLDHMNSVEQMLKSFKIL